MATPAQLQAQAAQLEIQIALLTQQIQSANTPASQQASLIIQRSQLQNDLAIVQQETTALTQESNPPDPQVPTPAPAETVQTTNPTAAQNPYAGAGRGFVNPPLANPEPQTLPREAAIAAANNVVATDAPADVTSDGTLTIEQTNANIVSTIAPDAQPDPYDNRFNRQEIDAAEAAGNESTAETARLNRYEDAAAEKATLDRAQQQQVLQARFNTPANGDWRVRIRLAPNSDYLYNSTNPGILAPLKASDGVIFPYTPAISTSYNADYDTTDLTHSNYRGQFYKSSNVGDISINGIFTAQDTLEAEYMLAVIHFFRSVTKMFYGQDAQRGAPPPLVYLFGLGQYQFNNHPCVVKGFNYILPTDVDYIRTQPNNYGQNLLNRRTKAVSSPSNTLSSVVARLGNAVDKLGNILKPGALPNLGALAAGQPGVSQQAVYNTSNATYVPTKIEIQLSLLPIQTRNQVSQQFSLKGFASGDLLRGGFW